MRSLRVDFLYFLQESFCGTVLVLEPVAAILHPRLALGDRREECSRLIAEVMAGRKILRQLDINCETE